MASRPVPRVARSVTSMGVFLLACVVVAACSSPEAFLASETDEASVETRDCSPGVLPAVDLPQSTAEELSLHLSSLMFSCADRVVVTEVANVDTAAVEALERRAPLLITSSVGAAAVAAEITPPRGP